MTQTVTLYDAKLLYRYYDRRAKASIGLEPTFQLKNVVWGKGNTTLINGVPSVAAIPTDLAAVEGVFLTNTPVYTYANGRITVRATLKAGDIPAGQQFEFTTLGILDDKGGLVAVLVSTPMWLHDKRSLVVEGYIDTNMA